MGQRNLSGISSLRLSRFDVNLSVLVVASSLAAAAGVAVVDVVIAAVARGVLSLDVPSSKGVERKRDASLS